MTPLPGQFATAAGLMGSQNYNPGDQSQGQQGSDQQHSQIHQTSGFWDWMGENVAKPAINAAYLSPVNDLHLAGILDAPKPYEIKQGEFLSKEWIGQTIGSVAGVVPYIIAGRAVGGVSRFAAETSGTEASWFGKFAASERMTMVAGAGIYDFVRTPHQGEARWSNSLGGMAMFGMCEWGNSKIVPTTSMVDAALTRLKYGAAGAASGYVISRTIGPSHTFEPSDLIQTSLTGGLINFGLPTLQHLGAKGANLVDTALGRGIPIERLAASNGWGENSQISELMNNPNGRLTRVVNGEPMTDGKRISVDRTADRVTQREQAAHEMNHKVNLKEMEAQFQQAKFYIGKDDPLHDPREMYINIRRTDEAQSRQAGAQAANKPITQDMLIGEDGRAPVQDAAHEAQFAREADEFIRSGGNYRPEVSYMFGGGAGRGGSGRGSQDALLSSRRQSIGSDRVIFDKDTNTWTIYGDPTAKEQTELEGTGEKLDSIQYEYRAETNKATGLDEKVWERITQPGGKVLNGEIWPSVEFHKNGTETPYGLADRIERLGDFHSVKYRIIKGNPKTGVPDNSTFEVYPKGLGEIDTPEARQVSADHGVVQYILRKADGTIEYGKPNDLRGWDYPTPKEMKFGDVNKIDERTDGTVYFETTDGGGLENFPPGKEITLQAGDTNLGTVKNLFRAADGGVDYELTDGSNIYVRRGEGEMVVTRRRDGVNEPIEVSEPLTEVYPSDAFPNGHEIKSGSSVVSATRIEVHPEFTRTYTASSITDQYATPLERPYGQVKYTRYFPDMNVDFTADGGHYDHYIKERQNMSDPVESEARFTVRGMATGAFTDAKGNVTFDLVGHAHPQGGSVSTDYPLGLRTSLSDDLKGAITNVERTPDRIKYHTNQNETLEVQLGSGGGIYKHVQDGEGNTTSSVQLPTRDIVEFYGERGTATPFGQASSVRVSTDGTIQYQIVGDPYNPSQPAPYTDVREFPIPRQTSYGQLTFAEHLRKGGYRLILLHGEAVELTEPQYRAELGLP